MKSQGQLLPDRKRIPEVRANGPDPAGDVVTTRDHEVIRRWAAKHSAEPATGEASESGPATVNVNDGGAGVRFNFPGVGTYRPISWDEWFANFDRNLCVFVYEKDATNGPMSYRYRIVKSSEAEDTTP